MLCEAPEPGLVVAAIPLYANAQLEVGMVGGLAFSSAGGSLKVSRLQPERWGLAVRDAVLD